MKADDSNGFDDFVKMTEALKASTGPCARCKGTIASFWKEGRVCDACLQRDKDRDAQRERERALRDVLCKIQASHRWAHVDAPELRMLVSDPSKVDKLTTVIDATNVTFIGPPGSGKTSLATALWRMRAEKLDTKPSKYRWTAPIEAIVYTTALDLVLERKKSKLGDDEPLLISGARTASLLLVDDLGQEHPSFADVLIEILHERHREDLPTITTSAFSVAQLGERYGGGIQRRLVEAPSVVFDLPARKGKRPDVGRLVGDS
jgi:DNA replication protein DnaC